ncbi:MAG: argininosuccinate lyase [Candidatus Omnitrophota bacterium]|jgi:argininosuccinate lyase
MGKKLWGGRFKKEVDKEFFEFQKSISYDYRLMEYDILHSIIHVGALNKAGILSKPEAIKLINVLKGVENEINLELKQNKFKTRGAEDIHSLIQNKVEKKLGKRFSSLALKLHSLRSRNDQVVFDTRFYCTEKSLEIQQALLTFLGSLIELIQDNLGKEFIGYTHTQRAQAIHFYNYLSAYHKMFLRDQGRLKRFEENLFVYIGAGALTGSSLTRRNYNDAIKELTSKREGKIKPTDDPIDNVSDRDFIIEFLSIISILQMHLSRLAEDLILYSTKEFNLLEIPEEFCTGSSLMPHKKNPDLLELVRGNTGKIYGNLVSILTTMKGLPLSYNKDMQLDKEPLFFSVEIIEKELKIMNKFIKKINLNEENIRKILDQDVALYATEIAENLVKTAKMPFKRAHDTVGKFIKLLEKNNGNLNRITDVDLRKLHPKLDKNLIKKIMKPGYAISQKKTFSRKVIQRRKKLINVD